MAGKCGSDLRQMNSSWAGEGGRARFLQGKSGPGWGTGLGRPPAHIFSPYIFLPDGRPHPRASQFGSAQKTIKKKMYKHFCFPTESFPFSPPSRCGEDGGRRGKPRFLRPRLFGGVPVEVNSAKTLPELPKHCQNCQSIAHEARQGGRQTPSGELWWQLWRKPRGVGPSSGVGWRLAAANA